ncbi:hypothetical protein C3747_280g12 [Trypanosoma cruzi]|uniref:TATA element modulatory factor 1 TATA binding domain-containing protein n=2 Tax=Trypanosoma cruzi TaxID=5693 RepID=Q4D1K0_TRYCC|nr:hypothetical protein, conserved [Trypanosoma cruzi]EAN86403.1 hypothetical protein, conserved [Trypanosoma cruzi]PWU94344.1 hypothetical protein C3747_280g12 [Trypanosoma cruzi]RNC59204.1 hypothetical protein TcCL_ESM03136 [Trypanosoma cruzi]|eukprot:XP_808254.1 hypothetical protein [Trypanosoma cruzi strain CL Brener]
MWGSWLDQIQKRLDDVSGLAEQAIIMGGGDEEGEEEEEDEGKETEKVENVQGTSGGRSMSPQPSPEPKPQQGTHGTTFLIHADDTVDGYSLPHEGVALAAAAASMPFQTKNASCFLPATPTEELTGSAVMTAVGGTEKEPLPVVGLPVRLVESLEAPAAPTMPETVVEVAAAAPKLTTEATTPAAVASTGIDTIAQDDAAPHPYSCQQSLLAGGGNEDQLLRFQQVLAEELEVSRLLREEKCCLQDRIGTLEKELRDLRLFKKNALLADPKKLEALEREGMELSTKLGNERERYKLLYEKKTQLESRVETLEKKLAQCALKEEEFQKSIAASHTDCEAAKQHAEELRVFVEVQESKLQQLQRQLTSAKQSRAELVVEHEKELAQQKAELTFQRESMSGALVSLQREKEAIASSLQRTQMEYERRIQELENKLLQANRRADQAEVRLTDHERSVLAPLRELRAALDDVERQKRLLMEEVEYWKGECSAAERSRESEKKHFTQRLADAQSEVQVAHDERLAAEQELQEFRGKHSQAHKALERALERASDAEAKKEQLSIALEEVVRRMEDASSSNNNISTPNSISHVGIGEMTRHSPISIEGGANSTRVPLFQVETTESVGDFCRGSRSRAERELVRQAVEIERLRRVEEEGAEAKRKLLALAAQHDLLMQMYGELQEELQKSQLERPSK